MYPGFDIDEYCNTFHSSRASKSIPRYLILQLQVSVSNISETQESRLTEDLNLITFLPFNLIIPRR
jgi:hypothetical protein